MTITQQPDSLSLLANLKDIIIQAVGNVTVTFKKGSQTFLTETYSPDASGKIYIRDMSKLLSDYFDADCKPTTYTISMQEGTATPQNIITTVIYSTRRIQEPSLNFLQKHFLTAIQTEKIIYPTQQEALSFYIDAAANGKITAVRRDGSRAIIPITFSTTGIQTVDVFPRNFTDKETIAYVVFTVSPRSVVYYLASPSAPTTLQFKFKSSFGFFETFIPFATSGTENKYENNFGTFHSTYKKYNANLTKEHTTHTGILTEDMADWLEDLFVSKEVYLLSPDGSMQQEITITDVTAKNSTAPDFLPAYEFKWRLSARNHLEYNDRHKTHIFTRPPFDTSFN